MIKLKVMSKSVNSFVLRQVSKVSGLQKCIYDSLFLFEGTSTKGPATFSSSQAPSEVLPLDVLRSRVVPAKS